MQVKNSIASAPQSGLDIGPRTWHLSTSGTFQMTPDGNLHDSDVARAVKQGFRLCCPSGDLLLSHCVYETKCFSLVMKISPYWLATVSGF